MKGFLLLFIFLFSITFVLALSPPKLTSKNILCRDILFNNGIIGASAICDGLDEAGSGNVSNETDPKWTANITNYFTKDQWNATNISYALLTQLLNGTFTDTATNTTYREKYNLTWVGNLNSTATIYSEGINNLTISFLFNSTGLIRNWNISGDIQNWNASTYIRNWGLDASLLNTTNLSYLLIDKWNATNTSYVVKNANWNDTNFIIPTLNNTYDLGNSTNIWNEIWVGTLNLITKITTSQLDDAIITAIKLAINSVNTTHILDYTILGTDIGNAQINASKITAGAINITHTASDFNATYLTNSTMNKTTSCSNIIGSPDTDFCTDATGGGGASFTTWRNTSTNTTRMESYISITPDAGLKPITDLNTSLNANRNYTFDCYINFMTNVTTTGIQLGMNRSVLSTPYSANVEIPVAVDGTGAFLFGMLETNTTEIGYVKGTGVQVINTNYTARMYGTINVNTARIYAVPVFMTEIVNTGAFVWGRSRTYCVWSDLNGVN